MTSEIDFLFSSASRQEGFDFSFVAVRRDVASHFNESKYYSPFPHFMA